MSYIKYDLCHILKYDCDEIKSVYFISMAIYKSITVFSSGRYLLRLNFELDIV